MKPFLTAILATITISFGLVLTGPIRATPVIGPINIKPSVIPAKSRTVITVTAEITDPSLLPDSVRLIQIRRGHSDVPGDEADRWDTGWKPLGRVIAMLRDNGKRGDATAGDHIYTAREKIRLPIGQVQFVVEARFRGVGRVTSTPISITALQPPSGFTTNSATLSAGGPLALNNFGSHYAPGGLLPGIGAAAIDVTSVPLPSIPLADFISKELSGSTVGTTEQTEVSAVPCIQVSYTDTYAPELTYANVAVYCPSGAFLYKFYLSYLTGDPNEANFFSSFQQVLNSTQFVQ